RRSPLRQDRRQPPRRVLRGRAAQDQALRGAAQGGGYRPGEALREQAEGGQGDALMREPSASTRSVNIGVSAILLLAASLRLYGLSIQSLWNDELYSFSVSRRATLAETMALVRADVHPPGYQLLLWLIEHGLGDSELLLRLPSALAGIAAVYFIFL